MDSEHHNHSCCAGEKPVKSSTHHSKHAEHGSASSWSVAHHATVHCLTGCVIGEVIGLMIGVHFGFSVWATMALATTLAFITGFALTIFPLRKRTGLSFGSAFKAIWLGETVSIAVMELVMNVVDYHMGGMTAASIASWQFWRGILVAVPAGYLAAYPVNAWLIGKELKRCH